MLMQMNSIE